MSMGEDGSQYLIIALFFQMLLGCVPYIDKINTRNFAFGGNKSKYIINDIV